MIVRRRDQTLCPVPGARIQPVFGENPLRTVRRSGHHGVRLRRGGGHACAGGGRGLCLCRDRARRACPLCGMVIERHGGCTMATIENSAAQAGKARRHHRWVRQHGNSTARICTLS